MPEKFELAKEELEKSNRSETLQEDCNHNELHDDGSSEVIKEDNMDLPNKVINENLTSEIHLHMLYDFYCIGSYAKLCAKSTLRAPLLLYFVCVITIFGIGLQTILKILA